jgi:hypothetical protein
MEAEATLKVPIFERSYSHWTDFLHGDKRMDNGPNYGVVAKWNCTGVRCLLVKRWVSLPDEWEAGTPIKYWTGYVYLGGREADAADEDECELLHYDLPECVGDPGAPLPRVTYPDHSTLTDYSGGPDPTGWIGWDNNFDEDHVDEAGPEEVHMSEADARQVTDLLAKGVRELWEANGTKPGDVYESTVEPPAFAEDAEVV